MQAVYLSHIFQTTDSPPGFRTQDRPELRKYEKELTHELESTWPRSKSPILMKFYFETLFLTVLFLYKLSVIIIECSGQYLHFVSLLILGKVWFLCRNGMVLLSAS